MTSGRLLSNGLRLITDILSRASGENIYRVLRILPSNPCARVCTGNTPPAINLPVIVFLVCSLVKQRETREEKKILIAGRSTPDSSTMGTARSPSAILVVLVYLYGYSSIAHHHPPPVSSVELLALELFTSPHTGWNSHSRHIRFFIFPPTQDEKGYPVRR